MKHERKRLRREAVIGTMIDAAVLLGGGYLWCLLAGMALRALGVD